MIQDDLRALLKSHYDIENISETSKLEGGYWNQTLKLETEKGLFVLRTSRPRTEPQSIAYQHQLMRFMNARIPEIPLTIETKTGETFFVYESKIISLLPFMTGEMTSRKNPKQQISAAQMLAKLHRVGLEFPDQGRRFNYMPLADFNWLENSNWRWTEIQTLLESGTEKLKNRLISPIGEEAEDCIEQIVRRKTQIAEELKAVQHWIEELKKSNRRLISAPTHGDYYPSNLLEIDNKISAVLDWDECQSEWLAYELGRALWEFCRYDEKAVMNAKNAESFLQAYQAADGVVPETEFDLLVPFIRAIRLQEILFSLGEAIYGEWWEPEYTLYNLEALDNRQNGTLFR